MSPSTLFVRGACVFLGIAVIAGALSTSTAGDAPDSATDESILERFLAHWSQRDSQLLNRR
jgi:hypothetical protein